MKLNDDDVYITPDCRVTFVHFSKLLPEGEKLVAYNEKNSFGMIFCSDSDEQIPGPNGVVVSDGRNEIEPWAPGSFLLMVGRTYFITVGGVKSFEVTKDETPPPNHIRIGNRHENSYSNRLGQLSLIYT